MYCILIIEPITFYGEGEYAVTDIKEVKVTKGFLSLAEKVKNCQNEETLNECQTKKYISVGLEKCNCTQYELRNFSKMVKLNHKY